jgi:hypothetical protein
LPELPLAAICSHWQPEAATCCHWQVVADFENNVIFEHIF